MLFSPSITVALKHCPECALFRLLCGNIADISLEGLGHYIKQTMLSNSSKWYADHFFAWSELNFPEISYLYWLCLSEGKVKERAIHKSFLDIAASLPQTHSLPASLCLSSKLHNPCHSCLDCRSNVIHKHGGERMSKDGGEREGWMGL